MNKIQTNSREIVKDRETYGMGQSMGLQRVRHYLATEQQQQQLTLELSLTR